MAAPKNNQFWKLRSKHGRDKLFADAALLWDAACEYFEWCQKNPYIKKDWVGKDAFEVNRETERPFTLHDLCLFLDCSTSYFREFKSNPPEQSEDFLTVITRIEEIIYSQKFRGAVVGHFNANIIARDLGLVDKQENKLSGSVETQQVKFDNLSFEQLYELKYGRRPDTA
ncbi:terminase small subunit [Adhaeribacter aquaticus]|uniref:terminase small subunit n=1 Tax=Adhaeribacter aquaticus TaxID=299567 RepID=UPI000408EB85|nr:terminase small subunit [Adhaeribacter aquaticus]